MAGTLPTLSYGPWHDQHDQQYYDSLSTNEDRVAFLLFDNKLRTKTPGDYDTDGSETAGQKVVRLFGERRRYWDEKVKKLRKKKRVPNAPQAPVAVDVPAQGGHQAGIQPAQGAVLPQGVPPAQTGEHPGEGEDQPAQVEDQPIEGLNSDSESISDGGEASPTTIFRNQPPDHVISLTTGERRFIREFLQKENWKFVSTLYQTDISPKRLGYPDKSLYLFARVSELGNITDHVVVKVVTKDQRISTEISVYNALSGLTPSCQHILGYRGASDRDFGRTLRVHNLGIVYSAAVHEMSYVFLDYAPHSSLDTLLKLRGPEVDDDEIEIQVHPPIPEHFIWYTMNRVLHAMQTLWTGKCDGCNLHTPEVDQERGQEPNEKASGPSAARAGEDTTLAGEEDREEDPDPGDSREGWVEILHSDLKPENIFLGTSDIIYRYHKRALVADFDTAAVLTDEARADVRITHTQRWSGTPGWQPPEKCSLYANDREYEPRTWPFDLRSDIYAVGLMAYRMMSCHLDSEDTFLDTREREESVWGTWRSDDDPSPYNFRIERDDFPHYTNELFKVVEDCTRFHIDHRIGFDDLIRAVDEKCSTLDGMNNDMYKDPLEKLSLEGRVSYEPAKFEVGEEYHDSRKRRRIGHTDEIEARANAGLATLANEWATKTYDVPSDQIMITALRNLQSRKKEYRWDHMFMVLSKRIPGAELHQVLDAPPEYEEFRARLSKVRLLMSARNELQNLIGETETRIEKNEEQSEDTELLDAYRVILHALQWGLWLAPRGEHEGYQKLRHRSAIHRGVQEYIFHVAVGAQFGHDVEAPAPDLEY